jgi:hypothetical protein
MMLLLTFRFSVKKDKFFEHYRSCHILIAESDSLRGLLMLSGLVSKVSINDTFAHFSIFNKKMTSSLSIIAHDRFR